jgi:sporulation protein YlmC with PRC-barrel domain
MTKILPLALIVLCVSLSAAAAQGAPPGTELVGLPVFAADGIKIGQVSDVSVNDGRVDQIRVVVGSTLGFGERVIAIPQPAFMIKGGSVLIPDLSAEDVEALPNVASENHGLRPKGR